MFSLELIWAERKEGRESERERERARESEREKEIGREIVRECTFEKYLFSCFTADDCRHAVEILFLFFCS